MKKIWDYFFSLLEPTYCIYWQQFQDPKFANWLIIIESLIRIFISSVVNLLSFFCAMSLPSKYLLTPQNDRIAFTVISSNHWIYTNYLTTVNHVWQCQDLILTVTNSYATHAPTQHTSLATLRSTFIHIWVRNRLLVQYANSKLWQTISWEYT